MSTGLPDFYRSVDVAQQSLEVVTNRPKYGGGVLSAGQLTTTGSSLNSLVAIEGRGMVYGGSIWLDHTSTQANSEVWLSIDGLRIASMSLFRLKEYNVVDPGKAVITINKFDSVNKIYSVGISYGLTFETDLGLLYNEKHGTTPTVHFRIIYTLL